MTSARPDGERIAKMEVEITHLKDTQDKMLDTINRIDKTLSEARGGWKTLMLVAGIASTVGAFIAKFLPFLR